MTAMEETNSALGGGWKAKAHNRHPKNINGPLIDVIQTNGDFDARILDEETGNNNPILKVIELAAEEGGPMQTKSPRKPNLVKTHKKESSLALLPCLRLSQRAKGLVLLNLVMLACASTFVVLKEGQENFDPFIFSSLRFVIAALAFSPFWGPATRDERVIKAGVEIGIWAAGGYLTQSVAMVTADASRGAFLSAFTVVIVPLLAGFFGTAKLKRMTWVSVIAALLGVMLLEEGGSMPSLGDFWNFLSAVLFGVQIYRTEYWSKQCGAKNAMPMMAVALLMIAAMSVLSMLISYPHETLYLLQNLRALDELVAKTRLPWTAITYMGVFVTDFGLWAEIVALQYVSSTEAAITYTMEPVLGAAFAYVLLGERWGTNGWIGAFLIVASCLMTQLYGAEKESHHRDHALSNK